jgi:hypothetical protein
MVGAGDAIGGADGGVLLNVKTYGAAVEEQCRQLEEAKATQVMRSPRLHPCFHRMHPAANHHCDLQRVLADYEDEVDAEGVLKISSPKASDSTKDSSKGGGKNGKRGSKGSSKGNSKDTKRGTTGAMAYAVGARGPYGTWSFSGGHRPSRPLSLVVGVLHVRVHSARIQSRAHTSKRKGSAVVINPKSLARTLRQRGPQPAGQEQSEGAGKPSATKSKVRQLDVYVRCTVEGQTRRTLSSKKNNEPDFEAMAVAADALAKVHPSSVHPSSLRLH